MGDILGKFVVILFGTMFLFFVPLTIIALKQDNAAQSYINNTVVEFVDNARASGRISPEAYEKMCSKVFAAHSHCRIELYHGAKYSIPNGTGEFINGSEYYKTDEILTKMGYGTNTVRDYELKEGDYIKVIVNNESPTLGGALVSAFVVGYDTSNLFVSYGGYVGNNIQ